MKIIRRIKWKNVLLLLISIISFICIIISIINIYKWLKDNKKTHDVIDKIDTSIVEEVIESEDSKIEIVESKEDKSNPYWDYIQMSLINVNFDELKKTNSKVVGWMQVNGTNINYPFVQTKDNEYYLTHSFDNSYNSAGWVFLDYRNNLNKLDKNTIIYAHGRLDNSMFGTLRNILKSNWINDTYNHVIKISTEYENTLWQVFSVYKIPNTSDYIQVEFKDDEFSKFINMLKDRSEYKFNTNVTEKDNILTLSTCYNDNEKVVLHAKLIKKEVK